MASLRVHSKPADLKKLLLLEGGDVILALGSDVNKHLLLHSNVLRSASPFFEASMKAFWNQVAELPEVTNPATGEKVKIFKYSLVRHDRVISLQKKVRCPWEYQVGTVSMPTCKADDTVVQSSDAGQSTIPLFLSSFAAGFVEVEPGDREQFLSSKLTTEPSDVVLEHQALFLFLHKLPVEHWIDLHLGNMANIVAYAELYDLLPFVAGSITKHIVSHRNIWIEVRKYPAFYLAMAKKIRSEELFLDALRHFVGSGSDWNILINEMDFTRAEAALLIFPNREEIAGRISDFLKKLQRLGVTPVATTNYKGRSNQTSTPIAPAARDGDTQEKAAFVARCIFNEWLNKQLAGNENMSYGHVLSREYRLTDILPHGLHVFCLRLVMATQAKQELELFDMQEVIKYMSAFLAGPASSELKARVLNALKTIVRTASTYAEPLVTPSLAEDHPNPNLSRSPGKEGSSGQAFNNRNIAQGAQAGVVAAAQKNSDMETKTVWVDGTKCAHDVTKCAYFTCLKLSGDDVPWREEEEWTEYSIDGLKDASAEWLQLVFSAYTKNESGDK